MGACVCHPEIETSYVCMKHGVYLCEDCLTCRDPKIYCKFRSSCMIWYMDRQKKAQATGPEPAAAQDGPASLTIQPQGQTIQARPGQSVLEALRDADIHINASCNGKGSCGKCKLILESGRVDAERSALLSDREIERGYVLACKSKVSGDAVLRIPDEAIERKLKVAGTGRAVTDQLQAMVHEISPVYEKVPLELAAPSLDDPVSDMDRLGRGLKAAGWDLERMNVGIEVLRQLAKAVREEDWQVTAGVVRKKCANEIRSIRPGNGARRSLGLAVDLGTTSIVVYLVDMADGRVLAASSGKNRQAACGDDVINRIICAEKQGVAKLGAMALSTVNNLISEALDGAEAQADEITNIVLSGNTTMTHLLLKIEPRYIRREPYVPSVTEFPILKAKDIGLKADPFAAVFVMPGPASYVGGDIVSGILFTGLNREAPLTLFIDVGTNGEIVLGNNEWLMSAACSAGPAFEGGGVRWGMRAEEGAIEKVSLDPETKAPQYQTVGGLPPRGICGSGMIDLISEMHVHGVIDAKGKFLLPDSHPCMGRLDDEPVYILARAEQSALKEDLTFSETDISSLILAKAAVYAGFEILLSEIGLDFDMVDRIYITGGFGQYLDIERAISIGLLPDVERAKFSYLGNSSIGGAYLALLSQKHRQEAREISKKMTYLDFSSNTRYMDAFTSALFIPHTNIEAFPSLKKRLSA